MENDTGIQKTRISRLSKQEFKILREDADFLVLHDNVVDKIYTYDKAKGSWSFPTGSRSDIIFKLSGLDIR